MSTLNRIESPPTMPCKYCGISAHKHIKWDPSQQIYVCPNCITFTALYEKPVKLTGVRRDLRRMLTCTCPCGKENPSDKHVRTCSQIRVQCPHEGCKIRATRATIGEHADKCSERPVKCPRCPLILSPSTYHVCTGEMIHCVDCRNVHGQGVKCGPFNGPACRPNGVSEGILELMAVVQVSGCLDPTFCNREALEIFVCAFRADTVLPDMCLLALLIARGYYDLAVYVLDQLETSRKLGVPVEEEFDESYGTALVAAIKRNQPDIVKRVLEAKYSLAFMLEEHDWEDRERSTAYVDVGKRQSNPRGGGNGLFGISKMVNTPDKAIAWCEANNRAEIAQLLREKLNA